MEELQKVLKNEVVYWLEALKNLCPADEQGQKADEILEDDRKIMEIVGKLEEDDELWETLHRCIEYHMFN